MTLWLGSVRLGAIPAVIADLYKPKDLAYFLIDTAVQLLFIDAEQLHKLLDIAGDLPSSLKTILVRGAVPGDLAARFPGRAVVALQSALARGGPVVVPFERHANDVAYIFYSGGHRHGKGHHPDRVPASEDALQFLEMITGGHTKIGIRPGIIQHLQLSEQPGVQIRRNPLDPDILDKEVT